MWEDRKQGKWAGAITAEYEAGKQDISDTIENVRSVLDKEG